MKQIEINYRRDSDLEKETVHIFIAEYSLLGPGMSCSEGGVCSKGLQYCSDGAETMTESGLSCSTEDTGTQYCSRDTGDMELGVAEYDFSVHFPVSLREEDCDWGEEAWEEIILFSIFSQKLVRGICSAI